MTSVQLTNLLVAKRSHHSWTKSTKRRDCASCLCWIAAFMLAKFQHLSTTSARCGRVRRLRLRALWPVWRFTLSSGCPALSTFYEHRTRIVVAMRHLLRTCVLIEFQISKASSPAEEMRSQILVRKIIPALNSRLLELLASYPSTACTQVTMISLINLWPTVCSPRPGRYSHSWISLEASSHRYLHAIVNPMEDCERIYCAQSEAFSTVYTPRN